MPVKQTIFYDDGRDKIITGVNILADTVNVTLGLRSRKAMLNLVIDPTIVARSGVVDTKEIQLMDSFASRLYG